MIRYLQRCGLHSWNSSYGLCMGSGKSTDGCMGMVTLLIKFLFVSNQTAQMVTPGSHGSNDTHFFKFCLVICDILITIRIVIGPWVGCILSSNPKQILLLRRGDNLGGCPIQYPLPSHLSEDHSG